MASRKRKNVNERIASKGKGKQIEESYDSLRFVSVAAQQRFEKASQKPRGCIRERGIDFGDDDEHPINVVIKELGWDRFVMEPQAAVVPIVKEFYANAPEHINGKVKVRGVQVRFDARTINEHYGLSSNMEGEYEKYVNDSPDCEEVISKLASNKAKWDMHDGVHISFNATHLNDYARVWQYFVCSRLLPSTHHSVVTKDRALMIYAIMEKMRMNVGQIIFERILYSARYRTLSSFFPQLITALCVKAGVTYEEKEEIQQPGNLMTKRFLRNLFLGGRNPNQRSTIAQQKPKTVRGKVSNLSDEVKKIKHRQKELLKWCNNTTRFMCNSFHALEEMLRLQLTHSGIDSSHITVPHITGHFEFSVSESEEEEEEEEDEDHDNLDD